MRESFIFYRSFYEALVGMSPENQGDCLMAVADYALNGKEPTNLTPEVRLFFTLVKPQIDANNQRFENGRKGGRPKTKTKPKENQTETKSKPNVNVNDNVNDNDNVNNNVNDNNLNYTKNKKYAFEGKIIKLTQKDFDRWKKAYPDLNLWGELMLRDDWLSEQPSEKVKNWFMSTSQYFMKQNELRKRQNAEIDEKIEEPKKNIFEDEQKKEHDWSWV